VSSQQVAMFLEGMYFAGRLPSRMEVEEITNYLLTLNLESIRVNDSQVEIRRWVRETMTALHSRRSEKEEQGTRDASTPTNMNSYTVNFTMRGHIIIRGDISPYSAYNCARAQLEGLALEDPLGEVREFVPSSVDLYEILDKEGDELDPDEGMDDDESAEGET
jgi:hypothetical protein